MKTVILPWLKFENRELSLEWPPLKEALSTLTKAGFTVKRMFDFDRQLLLPEVSLPLPGNTLLEVEMPDGWSLEDGYNGYGHKDPGIHHLVDAAGHLRGQINLDSRVHPLARERPPTPDEIEPLEAELYCRYVLNPFSYTFSHPRPKGTLVDTVLDRAAVDRKHPHDFPLVAYRYERPMKFSSLSALQQRGCTQAGERAYRCRAST